MLCFLHVFRMVQEHRFSGSTVTTFGAAVTPDPPTSVGENTIAVYAITQDSYGHRTVRSPDTATKLARVVEWYENGCPPDTGIRKVST